ncbi:MAG: 23S rRNA (uracil(1939)-C(5))-methyltransferase RlmD [Prolixibacteraceae bacterium]|nr:23S rRNA (uracil(1939)-C(5))-methyltransferase RlmD [Prolixibacteraceae bacterium]
MSRNKRKPFYEKVLIEDIGSEGKSLAKINDVVVFTRMAVPGDIVDLQVTKRRKRYQEAVITKFHEYSKDRVTPFCRHFGNCGGCKWQFLPYNMQLHYKEQQVADQLKRIGKADIKNISPISGSEKNIFYRNKLEFTFSNKRWFSKEELESGKTFTDTDSLGFHAPGMFDKVINIEECWLQADPSNAIRNYIGSYARKNHLDYFDIKGQRGFLRTLIIRTSSLNETMVILSFFYEDKASREKLLNDIKNRFPEITSLMYVINSKGNDTITDQDIELFYGRDHIFEEMEGLKFKIGPKSFYQTNSEQACNLYKIVRNFAGLTGNEIVYDLYSGTGTIAHFLARNAKKVIGIEYVAEAITDAGINALLNNISNTSFYAGDIREILNRDFVNREGEPDVIITDPPRAGMHSDVIKTLLEIAPDRIIYVSCNPATQARDILLLGDRYTIEGIQPVDMFPHTHHIENVVLLKRSTKK